MSYVKTLSVQQRQDASAAIRKLLEEGPINDWFGVCFNLDRQLPMFCCGYELVAELQESWPLTTGYRDEPVPGNAQGAAKWEGEQLTLRRSLLKHMLAELELAE